MSGALQNGERNHCIDLLRGLCLIGVIWHHTCLYSGEYVPKFMQYISFLLEAPALFFISGVTHQYIKREIFFQSILRLVLISVLISLLINGGMHELTLKRFVYPMFLVGLELPGFFSVLEGSYWFISCYVVVLFASMVILKGWRNIYPWVMVVILVSILAVYLKWISFRNFYIGEEPFLRFLFFGFFFLFGYWCSEYVLQKPMQKQYALLFGILIIVSLCIFYWYEDSAVLNMHYQKNTQGFPYLLFSLLAIVGFIGFYSPQRKNRLLEYIGRNSIFYFIGQGIACAFVVLLEPYIQWHWGIKLSLLFIANVILMFICSEVFKFIYNFVVVKCLRLKG